MLKLYTFDKSSNFLKLISFQISDPNTKRFLKLISGGEMEVVSKEFNQFFN